MTSQLSSLTPLGFTREYQAYRAANTAIPFPDSRLLAAVRFWSRFPEALASDSYSSFWLEDLPPLLAVDAHVFDDFHPDELTETATFIAGLDPAHIRSPLTAASLWEHAARKWLHVGEATNALQCLADAGMSDRELSHGLPGAPVDAQLIPGVLIAQLGNDNDPLKSWLTRFDADWRASRESGHTNQATCVLVERDAGGKPIRGRLRTLEAHIETLPKGRDADEVVFGHQLCTADDPQVRGAYAAVASLRQLTRGSNAEFGMRNAELKSTASPIPQSAIRNPHSFLRARFTFGSDNREPYGGDSLAFACLVAAYGDWWSKDLHRERRLVSSQVALTGALTSDGQAESVAENSLVQKVERVFFSPLSCLVVPHGNRAASEAVVSALQSKYPNRRLRILTADRASDLITDGNITIPERVCLGEYAVRAAAKYSRSVKVQVPILTMLAYLLLSLLYPKVWVWFDWEPYSAEVTKRSLVVRNTRGRVVGIYDGFASELLPRHFRADSLGGFSDQICFVDLSDDECQEIVFTPYFKQPSVMSPQSMVFAFKISNNPFTDRLDTLWARDCRIDCGYPGDCDSTFEYFLRVQALDDGREPLIVTLAGQQQPARDHIKMWSSRGDLRGWYINAGGSNLRALTDVTGDVKKALLFLAFNNRMNCSALFVITSDSASGVSPPYRDSVLDLSWVRRGNQLEYLLFPMTDVGRLVSENPYNSPAGFEQRPGGGIKVRIDEAPNIGVFYEFDQNLQVVGVSFTDQFSALRQRLIQAKQLPELTWTEYAALVLSGVRCWMDSGWTQSCD